MATGNEHNTLPFQAVRERFASHFSWILVALLFAVIVIVVGMFCLLLGGSKTTEKMALVGILQVGLALIIGLICMILGFALAWFDIAAEYTVAAEGQGASVGGKLGLASKSPSILFAICGTVLIMTAILKPLHFESTGGWTKEPIDPSKVGDEQPPPPPPDRPPTRSKEDEKPPPPPPDRPPTP